MAPTMFDLSLKTTKVNEEVSRRNLEAIIHEIALMDPQSFKVSQTIQRLL